MKKLLASAMLAALCGSAWAISPLHQHLPAAKSVGFNVEKIENPVLNKAKGMSRSGETLSVDYSPAYEPDAAYGLNGAAAGTQYAQALEFTEADTEKFGGNAVTAFTFYTGINGQSRYNQVQNYTIFITYDLEEEPVYTQEYVTKETTAYAFNKVELDTPFMIEADKTFYIGMRYKLTSPNDYTFVADGIWHGDDYSGGWLATYAGEKATWTNVADQIGFLTLGVSIAGTNMPNNLVSVPLLSTQPVVAAGQPFSFDIYVMNNGAENVKSFDLEYQIGNDPVVTQSYSYSGAGLPFQYYDYLIVDDAVYNEASSDDVTIRFTVTNVNGVENQDPDKTGTTTFICIPEGSGYQKQVVVEELTGSWCGYCPIGIVAMEKIREDFPDGGLIPVCVHVDDEMTATSWANVASMSSSVPSSFLNRQTQVYPQYESIIEAYNTLKTIPALGKVELTAEPLEGSKNKIHFSATTEFLFDMDDAADRYRLCFALTRDNVGPYDQTNYYSGEDVDCGGWENEAEEVSTIYNDVAYMLTTYAGIAGSIPASVTAGTQYTYERDVQISSSVSADDLHAIVYLLDLQRGTIENAATVKKVSGIDTIIADSENNAPVEYFNLQGIRISKPENGLYIRRQGNTATKVYIR